MITKKTCWAIIDPSVDDAHDIRFWSLSKKEVERLFHKQKFADDGCTIRRLKLFFSEGWHGPGIEPVYA